MFVVSVLHTKLVEKHSCVSNGHKKDNIPLHIWPTWCFKCQIVRKINIERKELKEKFFSLQSE